MMRKTAIAIAILLLTAGRGLAAAPLLDAATVKSAALRQGSASIEGVWAVPQKWDPDPQQGLDYRIAIAENSYALRPEAKYVGVVLCERKNLARGTVKLFLTPIEENRFKAVWITNKGEIKGEVTLIPNSNGTPNAAIDTSSLLWKERMLVPALVRVTEGL